LPAEVEQRPEGISDLMSAAVTSTVDPPQEGEL